MENIKNDFLTKIQIKLKEHFKENFRSLILYGSYARGESQENADIDLLLIFNKLNLNTIKNSNDLLLNFSSEQLIDRVYCNYNDFLLEKHPIYTEVKKIGIVLYGKPDLAINKEPESKKYKRYFDWSKEWDTKKLQVIEGTFNKNSLPRVIESIYYTARHAIQVRLSMDGVGFKNKYKYLLKEVSEKYNSELGNNFKHLKQYKNNRDNLTPEDIKNALKEARQILKVYNY